MGGMNQGDARLTPLAFSDLDGWATDDHAAALAAFQNGIDVLAAHPPKGRALGLDATALAAILTRSEAISPADARGFFEEAFTPVEVTPASGGAFFTGYYEPEVAGSLVPTATYGVPLHHPPADLVEIEPGSVTGLDPETRFARHTNHGYSEHFDRGAVMGGALKGAGLELVWLRDPIDAFFIHIQGAARIALPDGRLMRVTYAAKSGHPYTPVGRVLLEMGALTRENADMAGIRAWLSAHPAEAPAVMAKNRSYI
jgi:membrane-bound lytic murein transglycosylase A